MSEELEQALKKHKPEIIAILGEARSTHPCVRCERFVFIEPDVVCFWCRRAARVVHEA